MVATAWLPFGNGDHRQGRFGSTLIVISAGSQIRRAGKSTVGQPVDRHREHDGAADVPNFLKFRRRGDAETAHGPDEHQDRLETRT